MMPRLLQLKRRDDQGSLGNGKLLWEKKNPSAEPVRDEPLEGLKQTLPSANDGQLAHLFTRPAARTICMGAKLCAWMGIVSAVVLLILNALLLWAELPEVAALLYMLLFIGMHLCVTFSQLLSEGRYGIGLLALPIYYGWIATWFVFEGMF